MHITDQQVHVVSRQGNDKRNSALVYGLGSKQVEPITGHGGTEKDTMYNKCRSVKKSRRRKNIPLAKTPLCS